MIVPSDWMPDAKMARIILHWTAGSHKATDFDRKHYHVLVEGDGKIVKGFPSIALNSLPKARGNYAAHTLNCNTGSIGLSMCCMAGAIERPFNAGKYPLTHSQWKAAAKAAAALCKRYGIKVTPKTVLSHAEVQANLGILQRGKWDVAILPFNPDLNTAKECGDIFREAVALEMAFASEIAAVDAAAPKPRPVSAPTKSGSDLIPTPETSPEPLSVGLMAWLRSFIRA
jgi:hypothetical protein